MRKKSTPAAKYPPLPAWVDAPAGKVKVVIKKDVRHPDGTECWGLWQDSVREIHISSAPSMRHQWKVLFHELTHVAITDSGIDNILSNEAHEALCDAIAVQRLRERFGG